MMTRRKNEPRSQPATIVPQDRLQNTLASDLVKRSDAAPRAESGEETHAPTVSRKDAPYQTVGDDSIIEFNPLDWWDGHKNMVYGVVILIMFVVILILWFRSKDYNAAIALCKQNPRILYDNAQCGLSYEECAKQCATRLLGAAP